MSKLIRVYIPYWEWEDYINGMWSKSKNEEEQLKQAIEFTGNWQEYGKAMGEVIKLWPRTMLNTLTNSSVNRRAFLGHCAVCYKFGIPEYIVRMAWKELTEQQRIDADKIAEYHIKEYERTHRELYKDMGG